MATRKKDSTKAIWLTFFGLVSLGFLVAMLLAGSDVTLFNPKGFIAGEQRRLLVTSLLILVAFCVPVLGTLYFFAWKYRESNPKTGYNPHASHRKSTAVAIWAMPITIMLILAAIMVPATFRLEPRDAIKAEKKPLTVQVVALRWKWLFIYPGQDIATVNYLQIPEDTPVQFELTADETPMSSFWIPHLGGQLYAMTEHLNRLNLMADAPGDYEGSAAEINGAGFASMRFNTRVSSQAEFDAWVSQTKQAPQVLDAKQYQQLLEPSEDHPPTLYSQRDPELFSTILSKYTGGHQHTMQQHEGHH